MQHEHQSIEQQHHGKEHSHTSHKAPVLTELHNIHIKESLNSPDVATANSGMLVDDGARRMATAYNPTVTTGLTVNQSYLIYATEIPFGYSLKYRGEVDGPNQTVDLFFTFS
jgi:hypothetical protein